MSDHRCRICNMPIHPGYLALGAVADRRGWDSDSDGRPVERYELAHNVCASDPYGDPLPGWTLGTGWKQPLQVRPSIWPSAARSVQPA